MKIVKLLIMLSFFNSAYCSETAKPDKTTAINRQLRLREIGCKLGDPERLESLLKASENMEFSENEVKRFLKGQLELSPYYQGVPFKDYTTKESFKSYVEYLRQTVYEVTTPPKNK